MGFSGLIAVSQNSKVNPDLAFFSILLKGQTKVLSIIIITLAVSLTVSTVDTLVNAISSLIIVDGKNVIKIREKIDYFKFSRYFIIILSLIAFIISSKGFSILYLFLLADLLCCAAVFTVFYGFYNNRLKEKNAFVSILLGLIIGLLLFPTPDFSQSILVGILFPTNIFPTLISQFLLFWSFLFATIMPILAIKLR